jgi:hypothetical protein
VKPIFAIAAALLATPAAAQSPAFAQAVQAGQVGERYDGYIGAVGNVSPEVRRQINAINLRRRNLYIALSVRRNVTAKLVGMATACQLFPKIVGGESYMLDDRVWRRRAPGQPVPLPNYCR